MWGILLVYKLADSRRVSAPVYFWEAGRDSIRLCNCIHISYTCIIVHYMRKLKKNN